MRILILNWKDIKHPLAGGAEIVTHNYAKDLYKLGHKVTIFTAQPNGLPDQEKINNVDIFRQGNFITVYLWAVWFYLKNKNNFDIVIDQIHGIPFFTPLYVRKTTLAWIHEIAGPIWFYEHHRIVAVTGKLIEKIYFKIYKNIHFLVDCKSTKQELISCGLSSKNIHSINLTINRHGRKIINKSKLPMLVYIGRIYPMKRIALFIKAVAILKIHFPGLTVYIAGIGKPGYIDYLRKLISDYKSNDTVKLIGPVSESQKWQLYKNSWLHIQPSIKEGFGLTILEAASCATPTVCFNVNGLKDLVKNNYNGIIVKPDTAEDLAFTIKKLLDGKQKLYRIQKNCLNWSKTFPTWEEQTIKLEKLLKIMSLRGGAEGDDAAIPIDETKS